jgi:hypothetical protein
VPSRSRTSAGACSLEARRGRRDLAGARADRARRAENIDHRPRSQDDHPSPDSQDDPGDLGLKLGYKIHDYDDWLIDNVELLLDDELSIGSAGVLKEGAVAWVSIEVPDTITTPEGVEFRPNLLATTSHDGSLATTYKRVVTNVVCDNTMASRCARRASSSRSSTRATRWASSHDVRDALAIVHSIADDFAAQVATLTAHEGHRLRPGPSSWTRTRRSRTISPGPLAHDGREQARQPEPPVEPRHARRALEGHGVGRRPGRQHDGPPRGHRAQHDREERNMLRAVTGGVDKLDAETLTTLTKVLA